VMKIMEANTAKFGCRKEAMKQLGFQGREQYEGAARKLLIEDNEALKFVRSLFGRLASDIAAV